MHPTALNPENEIIYPVSDGEPLAETYDHLYAILVTLEVLRQYLHGQQATVLADQFLYYAQGLPRLRVAPDVMVIFDVKPGGRDSYKIWEEGKVPSVIFEMTSKSTQQEDQVLKKHLYAQIGVQEYWLFDPKGEWLDSPLIGYQLFRDEYIPIEDLRSQVLGLQLSVESKLIQFHDLESGQRLLMPSELGDELTREKLARSKAEENVRRAEERATQAEAQAEQERLRSERLLEQLKTLGVEPIE